MLTSTRWLLEIFMQTIQIYPAVRPAQMAFKPASLFPRTISYHLMFGQIAERIANQCSERIRVGQCRARPAEM